MSPKASLLIKREDADLALFDLGSPANREGHYSAAWKEAWNFTEKRTPGAPADKDLDIAGDSFDQYWNHRQQAREILLWSTGAGVYRVEVRVLPEKPVKDFTSAQKKAFLVEQDVERLLDCPKGELAVADIKNLGGRLKPLLTVPPGTYRVGMDIDQTAYAKHWYLKELAEYPSDEGPDFTLYLQKKA